MRYATVTYHQEDDGWWAESPDFPSFFAAGDTFEECKARVWEGLRKLSGDKFLGLLHLIVRDGEAVNVSGVGMEPQQTGMDSNPAVTLH